MSTTSPDPVAATRPARVNGILRPSQHPIPVLVTAAVAIILISVAGLVLKSHAVDLALAQALNRLHTGFIGGVTSSVYHALEPVWAIVITVIVTGVIWWVTRKLPVAAAFAGVVAFTWLPSSIVKSLVDRPRPDALALSHPFSPLQLDPSYPSGHTVFVTTFVIAMLFVLQGTKWMPLAVILGIVAVLGIAFSVTIDAVHYPTDALASILWAVAVAPAVRIVWVDWLMPLIPGLRPPRS